MIDAAKVEALKADTRKLRARADELDSLIDGLLRERQSLADRSFEIRREIEQLVYGDCPYVVPR